MLKLLKSTEINISCYNIKEHRIFGKTFYYRIRNFLNNDTKAYLFGLKIRDEREKIKTTYQNSLIETIENIKLDNTDPYPKISIIIDLIGHNLISLQTVNSILKQTYKNFEIIIIGSMSEKSISRIKDSFFKTQLNTKVYVEKTMQIGIQKSTGKYIAFCENGDCWSENHLSKKIDIISVGNNPVSIVNDVCLSGDKHYFKYFQKIIDTRKFFLNRRVNIIPDALWKKYDFIVSTSCWMIRKDAFEKCNFSECVHPLLLNMWLWCQICPNSPIFYISDQLTSIEISEAKINQLSLDSLYAEFQLIKSDILLSNNKNKQVLFPENSGYVSKKFKNIDPCKKRLAIFASFSKNAVIEDYVIYYLKELKKVVDGIIFIMDNPLIPGEIEKIQEYIVYAECRRHHEYDFGSYKRGFQYVEQNNLLDEINELILCNDSCYGPLFPFKDMFHKMNQRYRNIDFWGVSTNNRIKEHIQSFFLVFKKSVFNDAGFGQFLATVIEEVHPIGVILKYEVVFTDYLKKRGYSYGTYLTYPLTELDINNISKDACPLIKVKWFCKKYEKLKKFHKNVKKLNPDLSAILEKKKL